MPTGENSGGNRRNIPSPLGRDGHDREDYGPSLEECGERLGLSKEAVWQRERAGIRTLWRFNLPSNKIGRDKRLYQMIERIVIAREVAKCSTSK